MPPDKYCSSCGRLMAYQYVSNDIGEEDEAGGFWRYDCEHTDIHDGNHIFELVKIPV